MPLAISEPLELPCGVTLPNRLVKAAMTEGLADEHNRATEAHARLYRLWAEGGTGVLLTGNVQVHRDYLERPGNIVIEGKKVRISGTLCRWNIGLKPTAEGIYAAWFGQLHLGEVDINNEIFKARKTTGKEENNARL